METKVKLLHRLFLVEARVTLSRLRRNSCLCLPAPFAALPFVTPSREQVLC